ncbi:MAG: 3-mercaptopyruvate sulfurtransferase [Ancalomicrobiaceae bacterium]|nr:3-mercaptopyruvate sulfurtransferase [Ancalomicrobiaceae bacterium]
MPTSLDRSRWFVSTEWLAAHLGAPDVVPVDASWYLPAMGRDAAAEYAAGHIPGAVRFDLDQVADRSTSLPHMLPGPEAFGAAVGALGIGNGMTIVIYDGLGLFSAPRVWWTFKVFGAKEVYILDGGAPQWKAEGRAWTDEKTVRQPHHFTARYDHSMVRAIDDVRAAIAGSLAQIVDARPAERFSGATPDLRPGVKPGHMPGARNVPSSGVTEGGRLASADKLARLFAEAGVVLDKPIITSCGSGVTASILWLALETLGAKHLSLYDGSWSEWGSREDTPIVVD